ncbi:DUF721 domain-containing protein [Patescibacteria group bacterium]|nr:DUF721 domain-containing protein [Patescibacteria group bacterium]MBU1028631.1 DUF721 domain-containing protein [Patescibacteria group bacterium]
MIEHINNLMSASLKRAGVIKQVKTALVADAVARALKNRFGEAAQNMRVKRFKNGTATVSCSISVLAEEVRLAEPELIKETNACLGEDFLQKIVTTS